ncbi:helix-turn-helix transcriptional regulator [Siphonobacter sp. BAB-5385]|uniref:helix-turn-helix transcriptional regulator n=1 Tax=Siphonobacter sp. BAB-5385 TaxID=1864822 RepID=UPI001595C5A1|nr:helix-turn-helix transcriptional regulator [Siphonobacter sp. BAB-5385]
MKPIESQRLIQVRGELTQEEFASRIGLNRVNISNIENGIQAMSIKTAKLIKEHFGVSLDWLYGYTDDNQIAYTPVAMPDDKDLTIEVLSKSLEECQKDKVFLQGLIDKLSK